MSATVAVLQLAKWAWRKIFPTVVPKLEQMVSELEQVATSPPH
jgi:hypothetical protein